MNLLLFQVITDYAQWGIAGAILFLVLATFGFLIKCLPTWERIRGKEIDVRNKEAETSGAIAGALAQSAVAQNQLGIALGQLGGTLQSLAIEQRKATDNVLILQRVNADESQNLSQTVDNLIERIDSLEETSKTERGKYATGPEAVKKTRIAA